MRSPDELKPKSFSMNMTPMIDVVFLLIIFFIVSNSMIKNESAMKLDLPVATTGREPGQQQETGKTMINVAPNGLVYLGTREVTLDELQTELIRQQRETRLPLEIRIRTDRTVPWRIIEPVLVTCTKAGIGNVSFSVTTP